MAISIRRADTPESVAYWEHVERLAHEVRIDRHSHMLCSGECRFGNGESCDTIILQEIGRWLPDEILVEAWDLMRHGGVQCFWT